MLLIATVVLAACGGGAPATEAPAPTEEPATEAPAPTEAPATEAPATEPASDFEGRSLMAADCDSAGIIQGVEATGQYEVTFTLCQPDPAFLSKIAFSVYGIYPEEWLEATASDEGRTSEGLERPVGTGPYVVSEWNRGESVTFTANPNYWGTPAEAETLVFRWSTESAARLLELQSGTVDAIDNVGPADFEVVSGDSNLVLMERPALNTFYIAMTNTFEPFNNQDVRQAIAKGIDPDPRWLPTSRRVPSRMRALVMNGMSSMSKPPVSSWLPPDIPMASRPSCSTAMWSAATCRRSAM
jgi:ABC-type transport system substrate-binding protein